MHLLMTSFPSHNTSASSTFEFLADVKRRYHAKVVPGSILQALSAANSEQKYNAFQSKSTRVLVGLASSAEVVIPRPQTKSEIVRDAKMTVLPFMKTPYCQKESYTCYQ
ncbi:hypothetical protein BgiMline_029045 [Biomphalaria glabrata]|nr:hypothetical protein BgiMline_025674 [Biomphalaria glabrata]